MQSCAVIFDMDGVLIDSYQAHFLSWQRAATRRSLIFTEEDFRRTFGMTNRHLIPLLYGGCLTPKEIEEFGDDKERIYREIIIADFPAMPGAMELLASLHAAGIPMAIGSSGPRENVLVARCGLQAEDMIKAVVAGEDVTHSKPHPEVFLKCAQILGIEPEHCAVLEDSVHGLLAARAAGMKTVAVLGTVPPEQLRPLADMTIASLREIDAKAIINLIKGNAPIV